eukprot:SAG22_NODE_494_length_9810_cov_2.202966_5_plen_290_part_00
MAPVRLWPAAAAVLAAGLLGIISPSLAVDGDNYWGKDGLVAKSAQELEKEQAELFNNEYRAPRPPAAAGAAAAGLQPDAMVAAAAADAGELKSLGFYYCATILPFAAGKRWKKALRSVAGPFALAVCAGILLFALLRMATAAPSTVLLRAPSAAAAEHLYSTTALVTETIEWFDGMVVVFFAVFQCVRDQKGGHPGVSRNAFSRSPSKRDIDLEGGGGGGGGGGGSGGGSGGMRRSTSAGVLTSRLKEVSETVAAVSASKTRTQLRVLGVVHGVLAAHEFVFRCEAAWP